MRNIDTFGVQFPWLQCPRRGRRIRRVGRVRSIEVVGVVVWKECLVGLKAKPLLGA